MWVEHSYLERTNPLKWKDKELDSCVPEKTSVLVVCQSC